MNTSTRRPPRKSQPSAVRAESRDSLDSETAWKWIDEARLPVAKIFLERPEKPRAPIAPTIVPPDEKRNPPDARKTPPDARKPRRVVAVPPSVPSSRSSSVRESTVLRSATNATRSFRIDTPPVRAARPVTRPPKAIPKPVPRPAAPESPNDPVTRQMIDRDTLRKQNGEKFMRGIEYWRSTQKENVDVNRDTGSSAPLSVYVRKRPIFEREKSLGEYDVVSVLSPHSITTHNCLFHADLKRAYLTHLRYVGFSGCFGELSKNEEVFMESDAQKICMHAIRGGIGTIFMFGQTGSGKTYTMTSLEDQAVDFLLSEEPAAVTLTFIELCGKRVLDLLDPAKPAVRLREKPDGSMLAEGATTISTSDGAELKQLIREAHDRRHTQSTDANSVSSRSHAVCVIEMGAGKLLLVDLAGSERKKDSMFHDRDRQKEGAEINASLHALKECIRWWSLGKSGPPPFRLSSLTRVLAETFLSPKSALCVIATVSPCATDIEHTNGTLRAVHMLTGQPAAAVKETKQYPLLPVEIPTRPTTPPHPKNWSSENIATWLTRDMNEPHVALPKATTGAMLVRMSETRFTQLCAGDEKRGFRLFRDLHDRIRRGPRIDAKISDAKNIPNKY